MNLLKLVQPGAQESWQGSNRYSVMVERQAECFKRGSSIQAIVWRAMVVGDGDIQQLFEFVNRN
jgi:hypothetical protein